MGPRKILDEPPIRLWEFLLADALVSLAIFFLLCAISFFSSRVGLFFSIMIVVGLVLLCLYILSRVLLRKFKRNIFFFKGRV